MTKRRAPIVTHDITAEEYVARRRARGDTPSAIYHDTAERYSFAVPTPAVWAKLLSLGPIVDVGAGNGYWAKRLHDYGVDVEALEPRPDAAYPAYPTRRADHEAVVSYSDRALLMVWPSQGLEWASDAVNLYGGDTVAYIGDPSFMFTASPELPISLWRNGYQRQSITWLNSWPHLDSPDALVIYRRPSH